MPAPFVITKYPDGFKLRFMFHPRLNEVVHRIPSVAANPRKAYLYQEKAWWVEPQDEWYVEMMAQWAVVNHYCGSIQRFEQQQSKMNMDIPPMPTLDVPHGLLLEPYEYQKEGIAYALRHKRCILGDQPGLGKTLQAIGTVTIARAYPCLVICPAALKINWQREFKKFAGKQALILDDRNKDSWQRYVELKCCDIFITNYESLKKFFVLAVKPDARLTMKSITFDPRINLFKSVVIDESHKCKSTKTQQSKFVEGICRGKEYILELTGTPVVNDNTDLIQQLKIMGRLEDFGGYKNYVERFCNGPRKASNLKELNWRLWTSCFFRREKAKVLTQLPDKTRQYIEMDITTREEYRKAEADLIKVHARRGHGEDGHPQGHLRPGQDTGCRRVHPRRHRRGREADSVRLPERSGAGDEEAVPRGRHRHGRGQRPAEASRRGCLSERPGVQADHPQLQVRRHRPDTDRIEPRGLHRVPVDVLRLRTGRRPRPPQRAEEQRQLLLLLGQGHHRRIHVQGHPDQEGHRQRRDRNGRRGEGECGRHGHELIPRQAMSNRLSTRPPSESQLQHACLRWFRLQYPPLALLLFAVPNGGKRDPRTGAQMKYEGCIRGVADLILLVPKKGYASLCIEMKTPKGIQSEHQRTWQRAAEQYRNRYVVCRSLEEFMNEVNAYLL